MGKQNKVLDDLAKQVQRSRFHVESKISKLAEQTDQTLQNLHRVVSSNKDKHDCEMDTIMKAIKTAVTEEMDKMKVFLVSELEFMVEQLQIEVQRDLKDIQKVVQERNTDLVNRISEFPSTLKSLSMKVDEMREQLDTLSMAHTSKMEDEEKQSTHSAAPLLPDTLPSPLMTTPVLTSVPKTDHIKLVFPTCGRPGDDPDPLLYLSKCQDFLALHPLSDTDLLATFRTVLHGTVRDWWETTRSKGHYGQSSKLPSCRLSWLKTTKMNLQNTSELNNRENMNLLETLPILTELSALDGIQTSLKRTLLSSY